MTANEKPRYDLEERTEKFAAEVRGLVRGLEMTLGHREDAKQLVRSSRSVAANYIEANNALSKKDFVMRIKICRKEAKESRLWLRLLSLDGPIADERDRLAQEATELTNIFGAILRKSE